MAREVWYLLEDGTAVDPNEVSYDDKGVLMHKSGKKVARRGTVPSSIGVDPDVERRKAAPKKEEAPAPKESTPHQRRDMTPNQTGRGYNTR